MAESIEPMYYVEIDDPDNGLKRIDICDFSNNTLDQYCDILQTNIDGIIARLNKAIDPSLTLTVNCHKQEKHQDFTKGANVPISEDNMFTNGTNNNLQCGSFIPYWRKWHRTPGSQKTWQQWKLHWIADLNKKRDT